MSKKELKIQPSWCKGCGICVALCPRQVLEMKEGKVRCKDPEGCVLCGICEMHCPDYAIYLEQEER